MSDLLRLFSRTPTPLVTPLEDFTTEALAIAINHDARLRAQQRAAKAPQANAAPS